MNAFQICHEGVFFGVFFFSFKCFVELQIPASAPCVTQQRTDRANIVIRISVPSVLSLNIFLYCHSLLPNWMYRIELVVQTTDGCENNLPAKPEADRRKSSCEKTVLSSAKSASFLLTRQACPLHLRVPLPKSQLSLLWRFRDPGVWTRPLWGSLACGMMSAAFCLCLLTYIRHLLAEVTAEQCFFEDISGA